MTNQSVITMSYVSDQSVSKLRSHPIGLEAVPSRRSFDRGSKLYLGSVIASPIPDLRNIIVSFPEGLNGTRINEYI